MLLLVTFILVVNGNHMLLKDQFRCDLTKESIVVEGRVPKRKKVCTLNLNLLSLILIFKYDPVLEWGSSYICKKIWKSYQMLYERRRFSCRRIKRIVDDFGKCNLWKLLWSKYLLLRPLLDRCQSRGIISTSTTFLVNQTQMRSIMPVGDGLGEIAPWTG